MNQPHAPAPPPISVAICTCDRPDDIGRAVESVLAQDYPNFDVLVLDQSRDDRTEEIVLALAAKDARLHYARLVERGLSRAYNAAVARADSDGAPNIANEVATQPIEGMTGAIESWRMDAASDPDGATQRPWSTPCAKFR